MLLKNSIIGYWFIIIKHNGPSKLTFAIWRTILHTLLLSSELDYRGAKSVTWQMEFTQGWVQQQLLNEQLYMFFRYFNY